MLTFFLVWRPRTEKCAEVLRSTEALTDISTVMAKYPNDNGTDDTCAFTS